MAKNTLFAKLAYGFATDPLVVGSKKECMTIYEKYTSDELIEILREAGKVCGEPLTLPAYRSRARERGWPSDSTFTHRLGSWAEACRQAGVKANPPRGPRADSYSIEDCLVALRACKDELVESGELVAESHPSYARYSQWAQAQGLPSGPTVRSKIGLWQEAVNLAYNR